MRRLHSAWIVVTAGMLARLAWVFAGPQAAYDDAANYRALAQAIADGNGYRAAAGPTAYWTPAWPAWMALFIGAGGGDRAIALASVVLGGATIALVWLLARSLFSRETAHVAAATCAIVPSLVILPGVMLSENLALPLVVLAALALVRARAKRKALDFVLFGAAVACATYVRESCAAFLLAGLLFAVTRGSIRARVSSCAAIILSFSLLLAPWVLRNRRAIGAAVLTTSAGVNLCIGLGNGATGGFRALGHEKTPLDGSEVERHERGIECAERGLRDHPFEIVTLAPAKLSRLLVWDDWVVDDFYSRAPAVSRVRMLALRVLCNVAWWALLAAAAWIAWREREASAVVVALGLSVALTVMVAFGGGRFHVPMIPLLVVLASRHKCYGRLP